MTSKFIDKTYVSTDSKNIAKISRLWRRGSLSKIKSLVIKFAFETIRDFFYRLKLDKKPQLIVLLQPTSPLRNNKDIDRAISIFMKNKMATSLVSAVKTPTMFNIRNTLKFKNQNYFFQKKKNEEKFYSTNGAIYIFPFKIIFKKNPYGKKIKIYEMKLSKSIDIDTLDDFNMLKN